MQLVLARRLGAEAFGVFATAFSTASLVAIVASCGIPFSSVRFLPGYIALGRKDLARGFINTAALSTLLGGSLAAVSISVVAFGINDSSLAWAFAIATPLAFILTAAQTFTGLLQALQRPLAAEFPSLIIRPVIVIACVLVCSYIMTMALKASTAMMIVLVASTVALAVTVWLYLVTVRSLQLHKQSASDLGTWIRSGLIMVLLVGGAALNERLDVLFVAGLSSSTDAGVYSVVARLAQLISLAPAAVATRALPALAESWSKGDREAIAKTVVASTRTSIALAAASIIVLNTLSAPMLELFGLGFGAGVKILLLLSIGHGAMAAAGAAAPLLVAAGCERKATLALGVGLCINCGLNALLIPQLGSLGAAVATAAAMTITGSMLVALVRREFGIRMLFLSATQQSHARSAA